MSRMEVGDLVSGSLKESQRGVVEISRGAEDKRGETSGWMSRMEVGVRVSGSLRESQKGVVEISRGAEDKRGQELQLFPHVCPLLLHGSVDKSIQSEKPNE
ncbi:hypothetical protein ACOMHN_040229 [Nucella lapillus]